ncbi:hypothetical protein M406DRAFT_72863 [Cryphonectria parasitica EP155]|uniref:Amidoligase enzyme n=1 Tax=Cryphonectria parasitica (strain ATCC 38755 / EP155) TaxID=660469 RepID=A0A9P5CMH3_CRYP1|nr:uncharacterized protein M406DRAFT_72863 [Cryphonectria parasitica EP155]KAF3762890.1 hypothetical protein M406DRAFT_72863 [Cryphonectria parasitica EP155]
MLSFLDLRKKFLQKSLQTQSSFGVELEFLVAVRSDSDNMVRFVPEELAGQPGQAILIPEEKNNLWERDTYCINHVQATLDSCLGNLSAKTRVFVPNELSTPEEGYLHEDYEYWTAKQDASIGLPDKLFSSGEYLGHQWAGIEVTSPALWNENESFDEIRKVCEVLKARYWILTPPTCGLHVHYGHGQDQIAVQDLRNIAALLLAADPLLVQLHPESRKRNRFCVSNRLFSDVAQGLSAETATAMLMHDSVSSEGEEAPQKVMRPLQGSKLLSRSSWRSFNRLIPQGTLTSYPVGEPGSKLKCPGNAAARLHAPRSILGCVEEILSATQPEVVARLMQAPPNTSSKPAYSFANYDQQQPFPNSNSEIKKTVEFRQAAGTVDADEIITFAKLAIGLADFACSSDLDTFWSVILKCAQADANTTAQGKDKTTSYDVFNFLADIGLCRLIRPLQNIVIKKHPTVQESQSK